MKKIYPYAVIFSTCFFALYILFFPFPFYLLPDTGEWMSGVSENMLTSAYELFFGNSDAQVLELKSDSTGHYLFCGLILFFSGFITLIFHFIKHKIEVDSDNDPVQKANTITFTFVTYYLAVILLAYGLNKIFKWQFYFPEPNTLFTRVGDLHKDILYWSAMGSSYTYSVFAGVIEVIPAVLLLFARTRLAGALIAFAVLCNVVMINFGFDISVKLHSMFLLVISIFILLHYHQRIKLIFTIRSIKETITEPKLNFKFQKPIKYFLLIWIFADAFVPYVKTGNFNDDTFVDHSRPVFHGAYVNQNINSYWSKEWKRFFIHRNNYFIVQYNDDSMMDYELEEDTVNRKFLLYNYYDGTKWELNYSFTPDSFLRVEGMVDSLYHSHIFSRLEWEKMNLCENGFRWRIED